MAEEISAADQQEHERLMAELDAAVDAAIKPMQRKDAAEHRLKVFRNRLAITHRLQGADSISQLGIITRAPATGA